MSSLGMHFGFLVLVSVVIALASAAIRLPTREHIVRETASFATKLVVGILICCGIVVVLEWLFVRPIV